MYIDTHCHLNFEKFQVDLPDVVERAFNSGVISILIPGTDLESSRRAIQIAEQYSQIYAAVGIHPNDSLKWNQNSYKELLELSHHDKVMAIGEIGLDFYRNYSPEKTQIHSLEQQLILAAEIQKPVILHSRKSNKTLWPIIQQWYSQLNQENSTITNRPGVLHSFDGDLDDISNASLYHFSLGISGPITYQNASHLQSIITKINPTQIVLETDAPFLPPHPYRGLRNEPAYVTIIARKIAELLNLDLHTVAKISTGNANHLFGWRNS